MSQFYESQGKYITSEKYEEVSQEVYKQLVDLWPHLPTGILQDHLDEVTLLWNRDDLYFSMDYPTLYEAKYACQDAELTELTAKERLAVETFVGLIESIMEAHEDRSRCHICGIIGGH